MAAPPPSPLLSSRYLVIGLESMVASDRPLIGLKAMQAVKSDDPWNLNLRPGVRLSPESKLEERMKEGSGRGKREIGDKRLEIENVRHVRERDEDKGWRVKLKDEGRTRWYGKVVRGRRSGEQKIFDKLFVKGFFELCGVATIPFFTGDRSEGTSARARSVQSFKFESWQYLCYR
ncbi:hypothetical protein K435DRAFT_938250 [Dendrothele bispora CBS 962.96]|uniref:Uncharacterized protein n=1 Tax=Dendrothele bispora (strain CBS 962.96) TaxID=1314807 RepID=A0A4S8KYH2_DENBC|nr:hypothetical protein K435DRAFT_938250 [Dendrothele bispora CBS 962.96]